MSPLFLTLFAVCTIIFGFRVSAFIARQGGTKKERLGVVVFAILIVVSVGMVLHMMGTV